MKAERDASLVMDALESGLSAINAFDKSPFSPPAE